MTGPQFVAFTIFGLSLGWLLSRPSPGQSLTDKWLAEMREGTAKLRAQLESDRAETERLRAESARLREQNDALAASILIGDNITFIRTVDPETGWTLWRNPDLEGIPDTVLEADGLRVELLGGEILCIEREARA